MQAVGSPFGDGASGKVEDFVLAEKFGEGDDNHGQDPGPEEPVTRAGVVLGVLQVEGRKGHIFRPNSLADGDAVCDAGMDQGGTNNAPGNDRACEKGVGRVQPDEHTGTDESRGEFQEPTPVLDVDGHVLVVSPDVKPREEMPIPEDASSVLGDDPENECGSKGICESLGFFLGRRSTSDGGVHRSDRHGSCGAGGKDQTEFTCNVDDEEFSNFDDCQ